MAYLVVCLVAVSVAALTLFSGFGLGTMLMPAFALFFPVPVAVAATAVVHLANNLFKVILVGRQADWQVVVRFALPGAVAAMAGAWLLT
ncbi:MAG TPA: TSUP family transporter, partial [Caldilineaceae bacterium]|nr:TSUP family transporter [Caldilineaceae bacterium]